jgi:hypothetical protein
MKKMAEFSMTKTRSKIEKLKRIYALFFAFVAIFVKAYVAMPELTISPTKYVHIKSTIVYALRRNWDSPTTPHPQASAPPPPCFWGEGNTRWRERGWESPNSDEGHTLWYSL